MDDHEEFKNQNILSINKMSQDEKFKKISKEWFNLSFEHRYSYHFEWLGMPIIQYPHDIICMQELIWNIKPQYIIETGVARGGSIIFYASMLKLINSTGKIIGIDVDIREHNRKRIQEHPLYNYVELIDGSSTDESVVTKVQSKLKSNGPVIVLLDSNHTHEHVLKELQIYADFVTKGSYLVVFDTAVEDMPEGMIPDRPWGPGNNPKTAVWKFLKNHPEFEIDKQIQNKLMITVAPDGYLKRIK